MNLLRHFSSYQLTSNTLYTTFAMRNCKKITYAAPRFTLINGNSLPRYFFHKHGNFLPGTNWIAAVQCGRHQAFPDVEKPDGKSLQLFGRLSFYRHQIVWESSLHTLGWIIIRIINSLLSNASWPNKCSRLNSALRHTSGLLLMIRKWCSVQFPIIRSANCRDLLQLFPTHISFA